MAYQVSMRVKDGKPNMWGGKVVVGKSEDYKFASDFVDAGNSFHGAQVFELNVVDVPHTRQRARELFAD